MVNSPAGRAYHCSQSGSASTACDARTIGVTMANAAAIAAYQNTRAAAVPARPHTSPATAMAGPMMFRMSTRNSVTGWLPGVMMNPCSRKRKPRMKISRPRRQIISDATRRLPVRSAARVAASTTARPASHRKSGAAKPPSTVASRNAIVLRTFRRVHASAVCASIISRTAIPRAQSTYDRRGRESFSPMTFQENDSRPRTSCVVVKTMS